MFFKLRTLSDAVGHDQSNISHHFLIPTLQSMVAIPQAIYIRAELLYQQHTGWVQSGLDKPPEIQRNSQDSNFELEIMVTAAQPQIQAAALRGWSLLLTTLPTTRLDGAFCSRVLEELSPHLLPEDVDLRDAAGEAIALVFSVAGLSGLEENGDDANEGGSRLLHSSRDIFPGMWVVGLLWMVDCLFEVKEVCCADVETLITILFEVLLESAVHVHLS